VDGFVDCGGLRSWIEPEGGGKKPMDLDGAI
jgi:hypothetical protein